MSRPRSRRGARERTEALQGMLFQATVTGCAEVVERLLARDDIDVNKARTDDGFTPLCVASQDGHTAVVERLLARDDIDVNKARTDNGSTPLCVAVAHGHRKVVKRLLKKKGIQRTQLSNLVSNPREILRCMEGLGVGDDEMMRIRRAVERLGRDIQRNICAGCGKEGGEDAPLRKCSRCKTVYYCSRTCQKIHWPEHKSVCGEKARPGRGAGKGRGNKNRG